MALTHTAAADMQCIAATATTSQDPRDGHQHIKTLLYSPETIYLGLLNCITKDKLLNNNAMSALSTLVTNIVQERRRVILDKQGLRISKSLFIPYACMDEHRLETMHQLISGNDKYQTCECVEKDSVSYEVILDEAIEVIGVSNILCAVLLMLRDVYGSINTTAESVFDVVLQTTMNKFRVDYARTLNECALYGYTP